MKRMFITLLGAALASGCASNATPEDNAAPTAIAPVAPPQGPAPDVDLGTIKVAPGEVVAVPRPSRLQHAVPDDGPVHQVDLPPRAERDQPQMPAWHAPTPARCQVAAGDHHSCASDSDRRLTCASAENLAPNCKVVGENPDETVSVCCAALKESK